MLARLTAAIRGMRIRQLHRRAAALGFAWRAAQQDRDWLRAARLRADRDAALALRDRLLQLQPRVCSADPEIVAHAIDRIATRRLAGDFDVRHLPGGDFEIVIR